MEGAVHRPGATTGWVAPPPWREILGDARRTAAIDRGLAVVDLLGFRRWRRRVAGRASGLTLELGVGTGRNGPHYPAGSRVVGVDPDHAALLVAAGRLASPMLVCARGEELPFREGAFDTQVSTLVLCSVEDPEVAASELHRTLAPGGVLRGAEHVRARGFLGRVQERADPTWSAVSEGCHLDRRTIPTLRGAGFDVRVVRRALAGIFVEYEARAGARGGGAAPDAASWRRPRLVSCSVMTCRRMSIA